MDEKKEVASWLRQLADLLDTDGEDGTQGISLEELPGILEQLGARCVGKKNADPMEKVSVPVRIAAEYGRKHFRETIGLGDAARAAGVSHAYLSSLFGQEMGVGFANYLLQLRLEYAKKLLRESSLKIGEAAKEAGFQDYHYFAVVFRKRVGMSPADYRKMHR